MYRYVSCLFKRKILQNLLWKSIMDSECQLFEEWIQVVIKFSAGVLFINGYCYFQTAVENIYYQARCKIIVLDISLIYLRLAGQFSRRLPETLRFRVYRISYFLTNDWKVTFSEAVKGNRKIKIQFQFTEQEFPCSVQNGQNKQFE